MVLGRIGVQMCTHVLHAVVANPTSKLFRTDQSKWTLQPFLGRAGMDAVISLQPAYFEPTLLWNRGPAIALIPLDNV